MKKNILNLLFVATLVVVGLSACKKCQTCKSKTLGEKEVCEKDFNSKALYDAAIKAYEISGYDCK